jgi:hypothetical protein
MAKIIDCSYLYTLLVLLIFTLMLLNPYYVYSLYDTVLGRLILLLVLLLLTLNNIVYGLIFVLCIVICVNMFFVEGMTNNTSGITIGEENVANKKDKIIVLTKMAQNESQGKIDSNESKSDLNESEDMKKNGIDLQTIEDSIKSINSNTIPIDKSSFKEKQEINPNDKLVETFTPCCSAY